MSRPFKIPSCPGVSPADVFGIAANEVPWKLAKHYGVRTEKMKAWLSGQEDMPRMLYELLAFKKYCVLPHTAGMFAGWTIENGNRFNGPGITHKGGLSWLDIERLPEYRRADNVASRQMELIERLSKEKAFYKRQCELETRYGIMLRLLIDGPPQKPKA